MGGGRGARALRSKYGTGREELLRNPEGEGGVVFDRDGRGRRSKEEESLDVF